MTGDTNDAEPKRFRPRPSILILEPNETYRKAVAAALIEFSCHAEHAPSVDTFLDLHAAVHFDLVALAIEQDGEVVADDLVRLRTHFGEGPATAMVAISKSSTSSQRSRLQERGADQLLKKTCEPYEMAAALLAEAVKRMRQAQSKELSS